MAAIESCCPAASHCSYLVCWASIAARNAAVWSSMLVSSSSRLLTG
jgi:hypothetical protein